MNLEKKYAAKLMLAGEYGVVVGSEAITVPLEIFHARLSDHHADTDEKRFYASVESLRNMVSYIQSLPKNSFFATPRIPDLIHMIKKDFYIESTIPEGYGVGSSGAVSALIYDQFFEGHEELSLEEQHKDLATLESCFHGKSSGVDAMTCFSGKVLHFLPDGKILEPGKNPLQPPGNYRFFLLDSKNIFETAPLVKYFLEKMKEEEYSHRINDEYKILISKLIGTLTGKVQADPAVVFRALSDFQWNNFRRMIPENVEDAWINGQANNTYYLKINGSGGGFMLGLAAEESRETVDHMLEEFSIIWI